MIMNNTLPLIAWKLVWFVICVYWVSIWMFIVFFILLVFDLFLSKKNYVFVFFFISYVFGLIICFVLVSGQTMVFYSVQGW
jgi:hypothetical protein